jgi:histone-lysine N-methyltransferase SETMAR
MDKFQSRAAIKLLFLKGMQPKEIHSNLVETLKDDAPSYRVVKYWVAEFKRGRQSTEDEARPGRPVDVSTPEMEELVHKTVLSDRRMSLEQIADIVKISMSTVRHILVEVLSMKKLSARWVPRMLSNENKKNRLDISTLLLARYEEDSTNFLDRLVTQDEVWVHYYAPTPKRLSMQWCHKGSPPPRKFKAVPSAGKVMASIFWDSKGILMIDYLEKGNTINGEYYANELRQLRDILKIKRRGKLRKGVLLLQDNAPVHTAHIATTAARDCDFEVLPHPPYSPDLAPSDFYLFPKLKESITGRRYSSNEEIKTVVEGYFDNVSNTFFLEGLQMLYKRWMKCISLQGDYVEK